MRPNTLNSKYVFFWLSKVDIVTSQSRSGNNISGYFLLTSLFPTQLISLQTRSALMRSSAILRSSFFLTISSDRHILNADIIKFSDGHFKKIPCLIKPALRYKNKIVYLASIAQKVSFIDVSLAQFSSLQDQMGFKKCL